MKFQKKVLAGILLAILISTSSCKDSGSPESITELFLISLNKLDYTTMRNISTRNTRELLKIMEDISKKNPIDSAALELRADTFKFKIKGKTLTNDSTALVSFETTPQLLPIHQIQLIRVNEKLDKTAWKIDISTIELAQAQAAAQTDTTPQERQSYDGQIHPDADSVAAPE